MHRLLYLFFLFTVLGAAAQQMPERSAVRKGNRKYDKGAYEEAIGRYEEALRLAPGNFEATYDLGNALYKAERYDKATETLQRAAADSLRSDAERAQAFYNLGNALFKQKKLQEALESYKQSLRLNPSDEEAKYNYAYTKRLLDQNQDQNGGGNQNQNQDQNRDQNSGDGSDRQNPDGQNDPDKNDGQGENGEQNRDGDSPQQPNGPNDPDEGNPDDGNPDEGENGDDGNEGAPQPVPVGISPQEQEQMLDAIRAQEDKTQDKLKEKARGMVIRGRKNW